MLKTWADSWLVIMITVAETLAPKASSLSRSMGILLDKLMVFMNYNRNFVWI